MIALLTAMLVLVASALVIVVLREKYPASEVALLLAWPVVLPASSAHRAWKRRNTRCRVCGSLWLTPAGLASHRERNECAAILAAVADEEDL